MRLSVVFAATIATCLLFFGACSSEEPTSSSPTITAPAAQSPAAGAVISELTPTLTVGNASGASGLTYRFEVASDSGFQSIVASVDGLAEGSGTTSWVVSPALTSGTFFWRARASASGTNGPFSSSVSFEVQGGFATNTPVNNVLVFDPLTNFTTVGEAGSGDFRDDGWWATDANSYIRWEIPPTPNGFVEFQVTNLRNPNPTSEKRNLMIMWDPTAGDYTQNPFRVHIAKYDTRLVNFGYLRLRFISNGQETNDRNDFFAWNPNRIYTFRLEWGAFPAVVSSQRARVLLDGSTVLVRNYDNIYRPSTHWVELGMAPRSESLEQALYSNVTIGVRRP